MVCLRELLFVAGLLAVLHARVPPAQAQTPPVDSPPPAPLYPPPPSPSASAPPYPPPSSVSAPPSPAPSPPRQSYPNLYAVLSRPDLKLIKFAVDTLGRQAEFQNPELPVTVFLPTDAAFDKLVTSLGLTQPADLIAYPRTISLVPDYHLLPLVQSVLSLKAPTTFPTILGSNPASSIGVVPPGQPGQNITVRATSSNATILEADISAGVAFANIIDTVLQFWYHDLASALQDLAGSQSFVAALQANNLTSLTFTTNTTNVTQYSIFAPTDAAFNQSKQYAQAFGVDLTTYVPGLQYHVVPKFVDPQANSSYTALSGQTLYVTSVNRNSVVANIEKTPANFVGQAYVGAGMWVTLIQTDKYLLNTFTSIWAGMNALTPAGQPYFNLSLAAFRANPLLVNSLQTASSRYTALIPTDVGLIKFVQDRYRLNGGNLSAAVTPAELENILKNHIVTTSNFSSNALWSARNRILDTMYDFASLSTLAPLADTGVMGPVQFTAQGSRADLISPYNITVNWGRAYVHGINYALTPFAKPNNAAAATPSLLFSLVFAALAARLIALV